MELAIDTPNATTIAAMNEAQNEENLSVVDMSNFDTFLKSMTIEDSDVVKLIRLGSHSELFG